MHSNIQHCLPAQLTRKAIQIQVYQREHVFLAPNAGHQARARVLAHVACMPWLELIEGGDGMKAFEEFLQRESITLTPEQHAVCDLVLDEGVRNSAIRYF